MRKSFAHNEVITGANQELCAGSEKRVGLRFIPGILTGSVVIAPFAVTSLTSGANAVSLGQSGPLTYEADGTVIMKPWFAFGSSVGDNILVIETLEG